ncbi:GrpB family protein [Sporosarcina sp. YIM B06819]|uniref:GrpB family protein n=1 Tax=Sporosarcina sp. YIM B06819 TaxID=3081769 RepID=UPI00298BEDAA|nr:GrpB family protein [Sporosarcina sp. YIM B06819]
MRKVEVKHYDGQWGSMFEEESRNLYEIFGAEIIDIHHIGSTSVSGLQAKPIIDMMPVVKDIHRVNDYNSAMIAIGYEPKGENGISGRRYFQKGGDDRTHHVHMYAWGNSEINRHLAFRDYLRAHPEVAKEYGELKVKLAQRFPDDIELYIKGKELLASEIDRNAIAWYR